MAVIQHCVPCIPHSFQDRTYGQNNRVHNENKEGGLGCTVCGKGVKRRPLRPWRRSGLYKA